MRRFRKVSRWVDVRLHGEGIREGGLQNLVRRYVRWCCNPRAFHEVVIRLHARLAETVAQGSERHIGTDARDAVASTPQSRLPSYQVRLRLPSSSRTKASGTDRPTTPRSRLTAALCASRRRISANVVHTTRRAIHSARSPRPRRSIDSWHSLRRITPRSEVAPGARLRHAHRRCEQTPMALRLDYPVSSISMWCCSLAYSAFRPDQCASAGRWLYCSWGA